MKFWLFCLRVHPRFETLIGYCPECLDSSNEHCALPRLMWVLIPLYPNAAAIIDLLLLLLLLAAAAAVVAVICCCCCHLLLLLLLLWLLVFLFFSGLLRSHILLHFIDVCLFALHYSFFHFAGVVFHFRFSNKPSQVCMLVETCWSRQRKQTPYQDVFWWHGKDIFVQPPIFWYLGQIAHSCGFHKAKDKVLGKLEAALAPYRALPLNAFFNS